MDLNVVFLYGKRHEYWLYDGVHLDLSRGHYFGNNQRSFEHWVLSLAVL